ncbi:hypothetical protein [Croceiramulus getboli]|nr:hypothetical protein P8624_09600 [Flavobacteriaceae bacterium YJPT1-3]
MELIIYSKTRPYLPVIDDFMDAYYGRQMKHLASDLLNKGFTPQQISDAINCAIKVANTAGLSTQAHFKPVCSSLNHEVIQDCKLSSLGYGLVLLNADPRHEAVGDFQISLLRRFLNSRDLDLIIGNQ